MNQAPEDILRSWDLAGAKAEPILSGHINRTFLVTAPAGRFVLQRLNSIFSPEVNLDIDAVTSWIAARGLVTPRPVPTVEGKLWHKDQGGFTWRLLTYIEGETLLRADSSVRCREAGRLLGSFHRAAWDCPHKFLFARLGVHDTKRHLHTLEQALKEHSGHRLIGEVRPLAGRIIRAAAGLDLELAGRLPVRLAHGDPKISNVVFTPAGEALALIDLDTLCRMPLAVELGDALRSWCCPQGEDAPAEFRLDFCAAAIEGWRGAIGDLPQKEELLATPELVETIALELSARFCADALRENYFAFDASRYPAAGEHNLERARSQFQLAGEVKSKRGQLSRLFEKD